MEASRNKIIKIVIEKWINNCFRGRCCQPFTCNIQLSLAYSFFRTHISRYFQVWLQQCTHQNCIKTIVLKSFTDSHYPCARVITRICFSAMLHYYKCSWKQVLQLALHKTLKQVLAFPCCLSDRGVVSSIKVLSPSKHQGQQLPVFSNSDL